MISSIRQLVSSQRGKRIFLLMFVPLVLVAGGLILYLQGGRFIETDNAYVKADVVPISAEVSGSVAKVFVSANQSVDKGQLLFSLDNQPFLVAVRKAQAHLDRVRTELEALKTSYREKQAQIELAKTNHAFALRELKRQRDLKGKNFVSESDLDDLQHAVDSSQQQLAVITLDLQRIAASLGGNAEAPLEEHPSYLAAFADLEEAQLNLRRVDVRAPLRGVISKAPLVGQYIRAGNTVTALVASDNLWVEANFTETDLTHVRTGQLVNVRIDTYPDMEWHGTVESISPATGAEFSIIPAQNATGNWVKVPQRVPVRIHLDSLADAPALRAGLSAVVEVDTEHRRQLLGMSW
ncbi:HlyD family secretion protein [Proteobacteria bacterium 005FR1]|nr:HlyD family secretion protein [Proteobacteria bacterium 005FR1]